MEQKDRFFQEIQQGSFELTRLLLIRHGEVENTTDGQFRYNGHKDVDLSENGIRQIEILGDFLKRNGFSVSNIYSSDLKRSRKSAEILSRYIGGKVHPYKELRELAQGIWEGLTLCEVFKLFPDIAEKKFKDFVHYRVPGGENLIDGEKRVFSIFWKIFDDNRGKTFAIVAHGGINAIIVAKLIGIPYESILNIKSDFGSLTIIDFYNGNPILKLFNASTLNGTIR